MELPEEDASAPAPEEEDQQLGDTQEEKESQGQRQRDQQPLPAPEVTSQDQQHQLEQQQQRPEALLVVEVAAARIPAAPATALAATPTVSATSAAAATTILTSTGGVAARSTAREEEEQQPPAPALPTTAADATTPTAERVEATSPATEDRQEQGVHQEELCLGQRGSKHAEPPSEASPSGGLSCYAHGTRAQRNSGKEGASSTPDRHQNQPRGAGGLSGVRKPDLKENKQLKAKTNSRSKKQAYGLAYMVEMFTRMEMT